MDKELYPHILPVDVRKGVVVVKVPDEQSQ